MNGGEIRRMNRQKFVLMLGGAVAGGIFGAWIAKNGGYGPRLGIDPMEWRRALPSIILWFVFMVYWSIAARTRRRLRFLPAGHLGAGAFGLLTVIESVLKDRPSTASFGRSSGSALQLYRWRALLEPPEVGRDSTESGSVKAMYSPE